MTRNFTVFSPLSFFEKADAPEGQRRRIAGLVSTARRDRQKETILQRGLDFSEFLEFGWYNDNHAKSTDGVLGYPESVKFVAKGAKLPDGGEAPHDGHWAEGYLIPGYAKAEQIWELGRALQKSNAPRRLGFSIEGTVHARAADDQSIITKASVRNVAITHCPVNPDTGLVALAKSMDDAEEEARKALSMTAAPSGPGAGAVLTPESLDSSAPAASGVVPPKKRTPKMLTKSEAVAWMRARFPHITSATAERLVNASLALRNSGAL